MADWLAMGGYAAYVWSAYAAALVVLGGLTLGAALRHRRARRALERAQAGRREGLG